MSTLPSDLQVCRVPTPANHRLNSTNPRACLAAPAGVRGDTHRYGRVTLTSVLAPASRVLPDICDEFNCREATSHPATCRCSCGGDGHGLAAQVERAIGAIRVATRIARTGDVFLGAAAAGFEDEEW